jgi:hypothetical protein
MTKGDELVERGAVFLEELSRKAAAEGGLFANIAADLADDAEFLRKLKPSLVMARLRGQPPPNGRPSFADAPTEVSPPPGYPPPPDLAPPPPPPKEPTMTNETTNPKKPKKKSGGGPNPIAIVAGAFVAGVFLAKWIDWRGHAHPRF